MIDKKDVTHNNVTKTSNVFLKELNKLNDGHATLKIFRLNQNVKARHIKKNSMKMSSLIRLFIRIICPSNRW